MPTLDSTAAALLNDAQLAFLADEPETLAEIATLFESDVSRLLEGLEASGRAGDGRAVKSVAHALKGAALNVGATALAARARIVEIAPETAAASLDELRAVFAATARTLHAKTRAGRPDAR